VFFLFPTTGTKPKRKCCFGGFKGRKANLILPKGFLRKLFRALCFVFDRAKSFFQNSLFFFFSNSKKQERTFIFRYTFLGLCVLFLKVTRILRESFVSLLLDRFSKMEPKSLFFTLTKIKQMLLKTFKFAFFCISLPGNIFSMKISK